MSTYIKGDAIILSIWDGISAYEPIACLTSNSLSLTRNIIETQTKCEPGVVIKTSGSMSYSISAEGVAITTESGKISANALINAMNLAVQPTDIWRMDDGNGGYYYGFGVLTEVTFDASAGDENATFSTSIEGSGLILTVDPN